MKYLIKNAFGLVVLILGFWLCRGDESDFIEASQTGEKIQTYLDQQFPNTKVLSIDIVQGRFEILLENGFVVKCDRRGECQQDSFVKKTAIIQ